MAENRKTECSFAEYRVVKEHFSDLAKLFQPHLTVLAGKFLSSSLIGDNELDNAINSNQPTSDRATALLSNILKRIELDKKCYYTLVNVLKEFSDLDNMVGILDSHLKRASTSSSLPPASGTPSRDVPPHRGPDPHKSNSSKQTSLDGDSAFVEGQSVPASVANTPHAEDDVGIRGTSSDKPGNVSIKPPIAPTQSFVNMNMPVESTDKPSNFLSESHRTSSSSPSVNNFIQSTGPIEAVSVDTESSQQVGLRLNCTVPEHLSSVTDHSHCRQEILYLKMHNNLQISETDYWKGEHQKRECELTKLTKQNSQHHVELVEYNATIKHLKEDIVEKNELIAELKCSKEEVQVVLEREKRTKEDLVATQSRLIEAEHAKGKVVGELEKETQHVSMIKMRLEYEVKSAVLSIEMAEKNKELSDKAVALLEQKNEMLCREKEHAVAKQKSVEMELEKLQKQMDALNLMTD